MSTTAPASERVCNRILGWRLYLDSPRGTTHIVRSSGKRSSTPASVSSSTSPSFTPGHTTTCPCTSMPASSSRRSQRSDTAPRRFWRIAARTSGSVEWMDTYSGDSRSVTTRSKSQLGEAGERREVPVEERQPVVVVLEVQRPAHAPRELVHEAELAVVVAGLHAVEHGRVDLRAERLALALVHHHREPVSGPLHLQGNLCPVAEQLPADHVAGRLPGDGRDLVPGPKPRPLGRRSGRDSHDLWTDHRPRLPAGGRRAGHRAGLAAQILHSQAVSCILLACTWCQAYQHPVTPPEAR